MHEAEIGSKRSPASRRLKTGRARENWIGCKCKAQLPAALHGRAWAQAGAMCHAAC